MTSENCPLIDVEVGYLASFRAKLLLLSGVSEHYAQLSSPFIRVGSSVGDVVHWQAPLQPNAFDCGVYTLRFLQVFVESVDKGLFQVLNCLRWLPLVLATPWAPGPAGGFSSSTTTY